MYVGEEGSCFSVVTHLRELCPSILPWIKSDFEACSVLHYDYTENSSFSFWPGSRQDE